MFRYIVTVVRGNSIIFQGEKWPVFDLDLSEVGPTVTCVGTFTNGKFTEASKTAYFNPTTQYIYAMRIA